MIPDSYLEISSVSAQTRAFRICLRNSFPSHLPSAAPSISPGISIITKGVFACLTTPRFGIKVVKGYSAVLAAASLTVFNKEVLPTLGNHNKATSAKSCNSHSISFTSPGSPRSQKLLYCVVAFLKCIFQIPPLPPASKRYVCHGCSRVHRVCLFETSLTIVPSGSGMTRSSASLPYCSFILPGSP